MKKAIIFFVLALISLGISFAAALGGGHYWDVEHTGMHCAMWLYCFIIAILSGCGAISAAVSGFQELSEDK